MLRASQRLLPNGLPLVPSPAGLINILQPLLKTALRHSKYRSRLSLRAVDLPKRSDSVQNVIRYRLGSCAGQFRREDHCLTHGLDKRDSLFLSLGQLGVVIFTVCHACEHKSHFLFFLYYRWYISVFYFWYFEGGATSPANPLKTWEKMGWGVEKKIEAIVAGLNLYLMAIGYT
jgi:hypothetical protein